MYVIHHNPNCSTSRRTLERLEATGERVEVIRYLEDGWTRAQLLGLFAAAGVTPREALRAREPQAGDLADADDEAILAAMVAHPVLVERPIVCGPYGVRLCRPGERVAEILPPSGHPAAP
ncbi:MAG: arsenate reductase family protein [Rubellimicrobium sp.]|nr:arsenate reductase family protein [Rubellimicrobium sp.]